MKLLVTLSALLMTSCSLLPPDNQDIAAKKAVIDTYSGQTAEALFAGGCFWCTEADFEKLDGVITVISGYAGGEIENPTYKEVASGGTGHIESILVSYDPTVITYRELTDYLLRTIDPTDAGGQFVDRGYQYSSAIFYGSEEEKVIAEESIAALEAENIFDTPIVTQIIPTTTFYPAEDYHQDYYKENPIRYRYYRSGSGRDAFLEEVWGT